MNFASDNVHGVHPAILQGLAAANGGTAVSYGRDDLSNRAEAKLSEVFEHEVKAFLVTTGTAANGLALSAITPGYGAILAHAEAHVASEECYAPGLFTGGAKIAGLPGAAGKLSPFAIEKWLETFTRGVFDSKPCGVSITNATELGTVYRPDELRAIKAAIAPRNMKLHLDGARFANAVAHLGVTPADLSWKAGVDIMSFGATKNGAAMLEAVVIFEPELAEDFGYRRMRAGQLVSKSRFLGAQMMAYLEDGLWLRNAGEANAKARALADGLAPFAPLVRVAHPVESNTVFVILPRQFADRLAAAGARFSGWLTGSVADQMAPGETFIRLALSYATPDDDIADFLRCLAGLTG